MGFNETVLDYNPVDYVPKEAGVIVKFDRDLMRWEDL